MGNPIISFSERGYIYLHQTTLSALGVSYGDRVAIMPLDNAWYIAPSAEGLEVRQQREGKNSAWTYCQQTCKSIRKAARRYTGGFRCPIAPEPVEIEGQKCFPILTKSSVPTPSRY